MHSPTKTILIGAIICPLALTLTAHPALAGGGTGDNSTPTTPTQTTSETPTTSSSSSSQSVVPLQVNQQSLISNWSGSALTPPSCNGGCFYAVTRAAPATYGSGTNIEAMIGVTIPLGSNDGGVGELNRLNAEMQKYRSEHEIKLALTEKLADAIESGKVERARLVAMMLAPHLGYKDYRLLLNTVTAPRASERGQLLGLAPISVSVMF
jgi:hypothetical protein